MTRRAVLVPVRGILLGKTRLAERFSPELRSQLVESMARNVVRAAIASEVFDDVVVVSARTDLLYQMLAEYPSIHVLEQPDHLPGLNPALDLGRSWVRAQGATSLTAISADLPNIHPADIQNLLQIPADVVIATDQAGVGTNGLMLNGRKLVEQFVFGFGLESRHRHIEEAGRLVAQAEVVDIQGFAFDLDTLEDWSQLDDRTRHRLLGSGAMHSQLVAGT